MNKLLLHLQSEYSKNPTPFFGLLELKAKFGKDTSGYLNELNNQGYIRKREGMNGVLVELLKTEQ